MKPLTASRLKFNAPLGRMPTLQFCRPAELRIDPSYQRSIEGGSSQSLIRRIAQFWSWDLCQPLVVARRGGLAGERLFVIDGQHRLEAARLRGDIDQLPCVIVNYASVEDEAASFVHLNQHRRALSSVDVFKAAVASGDPQANAISAAMAEAGLTLAPHQNYISWKPGMVYNLAGIRRVWADNGEKVCIAAMRALADVFGAQVLQYAGTIFPGIAAVCADEMAAGKPFSSDRFERFQTMLAMRSQVDWRNDMLRVKGDNPAEPPAVCSAISIRRAWAAASGDGAKPKLKFVGGPDGMAWCEQCEMRIGRAQAESCRSRFCSLKVAP